MTEITLVAWPGQPPWLSHMSPSACRMQSVQGTSADTKQPGIKSRDKFCQFFLLQSHSMVHTKNVRKCSKSRVTTLISFLIQSLDASILSLLKAQYKYLEALMCTRYLPIAVE